MDDDQQFCLRWNNHQSTLISVFDTLLENGTLVDCTLAAEGKFLKAHKVVLSACSPYFAALLSQQYDKHPIFILKDVKFQELRAMMDYMYRGEVNISQDQLAALLKAAESLQIKGLSDSRGSSGSGGSSQKADTSTKTHASVPAAKQTSAGLTIEQKRPRIEKQHPATLDTEPDVSDSREGSTSPNSRKRKKVRRRSIETNNIGDNHDQHSNSSSHSMPHAALSTHTTSMPTITSATSSASVLNVTKKTDHQSHESKGDIERDVDDSGDARADGGETHPLQVSRSKQSAAHGGETESTAKDKMEHSTHPDMLLEPKNEYDESNDGNVEDLTLDDEELLEDLEQAGPSHGGGEGSSQGYAQWQIERSQDEVFMAGQEAAGQHRDAQDDEPVEIEYLTPKKIPQEGIIVETVEDDTVDAIEDDVKEVISYQRFGRTTKIPADVKREITFGDVLSGCLLENENIVVTQKNDKFVLLEINTPSTEKRKETAEGETKRAVITDISDAKRALQEQSQKASKPTAVTTSVVTSAAAAVVPPKVATKNHPRIKYSMKQPVPVSMHKPINKFELLNFSLSRKYGKQFGEAAGALLGGAATVGGVSVGGGGSAASAAPNATTASGGASTLSVIETEIAKVPASIIIAPNSNKSSNINEDLQSSIMGDLSNYEIDDIELPDGTQIGFSDSTTDSIERDQTRADSNYESRSADDTKFAFIEGRPLQNYEFSQSDSNDDGGRQYICRHCGKKYRWKSTLRRHENVECGGKEPMHQCPHCAYRAKQRGNLGVHIRKHHSEMPQLETRRKHRSM